MSNKNGLREGFTTGSAATAAAQAAVTLLCVGSCPDNMTIALPPFASSNEIILPKRDATLNLPISNCSYYPQGTRCDYHKVTIATVIKDGGDDPDATSGLRINVMASFDLNSIRKVAEGRSLQATTMLSPEELERVAYAPISLGENVFLTTGEGIGIVTLPGLSVKQGEPAINPEPRMQIAYAARKVARSFKIDKPIFLYLFIPDGEARSKETINSRLGILGGISILGTRGTVRPFSHSAWLKSILQSLNVAAANQVETIVFCTGRRSQEAMEKLYPHLAPESFIQVADFAHASLIPACKHNFKAVIWACFSGKLLKLAQGIRNTHAKNAVSDIPLLVSVAQSLGLTIDIAESILHIPTAQGCFDSLLDYGFTYIYNKTALHIARKSKETLEAWKSSVPNCDTKIKLCLLQKDGKLWLTL